MRYRHQRKGVCDERKGDQPPRDREVDGQPVTNLQGESEGLYGVFEKKERPMGHRLL
jgi:hypothetical protein